MSAAWKRRYLLGVILGQSKFGKGIVQLLNIVCDGFGLIVKNHADEVETRRFDVGVESSRLIYKYTDLFYLFAHIRKK